MSLQVFTSLALFNILISPLNAFPWVINGLVEAWVSVKRVQNYLQLEELDLDEYYSSCDSSGTNSTANHEDLHYQDFPSPKYGSSVFTNKRKSSNKVVVDINDGRFTWSRDDPSGQTGNTNQLSFTEKNEGLLEEDPEAEPKPVEFVLSGLNLTIKSVS